MRMQISCIQKYIIISLKKFKFVERYFFVDRITNFLNHEIFNKTNNYFCGLING